MIFVVLNIIQISENETYILVEMLDFITFEFRACLNSMI